jgi:twitching motility protein PilI
MARLSLMEFQQALSRRLATAAESKQSNTALLAVESGGEAWLLPLAEAGEVLPVPKLTPAPHAKPWYAGMVNIRGSLYSIVDFGVFRGAPAVRVGAASRVLLCGQRHGLNAGLLVDRILGLRDGQALKVAGNGAPAPGWQKSLRDDGEGRQLRELDVAALMKSDEFMNIGM